MKYPAADDRKLKNIIKQIASTTTNPFYLYDEAVIVKNMRYIDSCFSWQDGYMNYFPIRENPNPFLLSILWNAGSGLLACGTTELLLCKKLGFSGSRVMYQPDIADASGTAIAEEIEAAWFVTSPALMPTKPCNTVLLRYFPDQNDGSKVSPRAKNGLTKQELLEMLRILHVRSTPCIGLEVQLKPFDYNVHAYSNKAKVLFSLIREVQTLSNINISLCNLGDTVRQENRNDLTHCLLKQEAEHIRSMLEQLKLPHKPAIQTALSRHTMESAGLLVSKILDIRTLHQKQLVLNVSSAQFLRPVLFRSQKDISIIPMTKNQDRSPQLYNVVGPIPEEFDRLLPERVLLTASAGDLCVLHDVGCGGRAMPMLYQFQPLCAEYLIDTNRNIHKIAEERSSEEVMAFLIGKNYAP